MHHPHPDRSTLGHHMPQIMIRPAISTDINNLILFDHDVETEYVWQMDRSIEEDQVQVVFRQMRLPRCMMIRYPRKPEDLKETWNKKNLLLVSLIKTRLIGYVGLVIPENSPNGLITDLVIDVHFRRQGVASALVLAAREWLRRSQQVKKLIIEMLPKNYPAIKMAKKLGFEFCGYNDHYYSGQDIALFFGCNC